MTRFINTANALELTGLKIADVLHLRSLARHVSYEQPLLMEWLGLRSTIPGYDESEKMAEHDLLYSICDERLQALARGIANGTENSIISFDPCVVSGYRSMVLNALTGFLYRNHNMVVVYSDWRNADRGVELVLHTLVPPACLREYGYRAKIWFLQNKNRGWYSLGEKLTVLNQDELLKALIERL